MVSSQFHYTKRNRFMPFLLAEILNFQGSTHRIGVGSFSKIFIRLLCRKKQKKETPIPSRLRGRGVEVSKTLFYCLNFYFPF